MTEHAANLYFYPNPKQTRLPRLVDGVHVFPDGREVCMTREAWDARRELVWRRDHGKCRTCGRPVPLHTEYTETGSIRRFAAICDHITKRGMGGGRRDDRSPNLRTVCKQCDTRRENGAKPCPPKPRLQA